MTPLPSISLPPTPDFDLDEITLNSRADILCKSLIKVFNLIKSLNENNNLLNLINFLKIDLGNLIKTNHSISMIDQENQKIKLSFENNETFDCDYLIISDGVFSKSKNLISKNQIHPKYNNTLAIRGIISTSSNVIDKKNISLFLGPDFHHVIYPVNPCGDLNLIAIMKYNLSSNEQKNYSLFNDENFILNKDHGYSL